MSTALTTPPTDQIDAIERAVVQGDLTKLTPEQRVQHYLRVCQSLGLNPHTQPFDYITLNGKLQLYAKRACTDQLRELRRISVLAAEEKLDADGVLTVSVDVQDADGRRDTDRGCVYVAGLKGEALANAHMKALTKAKRRATLSICGLGWLDETEVETIPNARREQSPPRIESKKKPPPADGAELLARLQAREADLVAEGICDACDLIKHVSASGLRAGLNSDISTWGKQGIDLASKLVPAWLEEARARKANAAKLAPEPEGDPEPDAPDQAPPPGEKIGTPEVKDLERLVAAGRITWKECMKEIGLPIGTTAPELLNYQYRGLVRFLNGRINKTKAG